MRNVIRTIVLFLICHPLVGQFGMIRVNRRSAAAPSIIGPMDVYFPLNTSTAGTTLTTTILNNGTVGGANVGAWSLSTSPLTGMTVAAHQANSSLLGTVYVNGTSYPTSTTSTAIAFDHAQSARKAILAMPAGHPKLSWSGWITFGPPDVGAASVLFDYIVFHGQSSGHFACVQLRNGNAPGYVIRIETNPGGVTTHSSNITITPGGTYWVSLLYDTVAGLAQMAVFDTTGAQVGSTVTSAMDATSEVCDQLYIGNNETGTASGSTSYFENWVLDLTNLVFPVGPANTTFNPVEVWQRANNQVTSGSTVAQTISPTAGHTLVVALGNVNSRTISKVCTDGSTCAAGNSFTQATGAQATSSTLRTDVWYLLSAPSGVTTITATFSGTVTNGEIQVWELSGLTAFDVAGVVNSGTSVSNTSTGASVSTTGTNGFVVGMISVANGITANPKLGNAFINGGVIWSNTTDAAASLIRTASGSYQPAWTNNNATGAFCASTVAFK